MAGAHPLPSVGDLRSSNTLHDGACALCVVGIGRYGRCVYCAVSTHQAARMGACTPVKWRRPRRLRRLSHPWRTPRTVALAPRHGTGAYVRRTNTIDGIVDGEAEQVRTGGPWATGRDAGTREPVRRRRWEAASIGSRATARVLALHVPTGRRSRRADPPAKGMSRIAGAETRAISKRAEDRQVGASSLPLPAEKSSIRRQTGVNTSMVPADRLGRRLGVDTKTHRDPLVGKPKSTEPSGLGGDALIPRGNRGHTERYLEPNPRVGAQSLRPRPPFPRKLLNGNQLRRSAVRYDRAVEA